MPHRFDIVAHRGVPNELPENTLPSFERAIQLGADVIELDVRLTRDRVPVVYHYFYLGETTPASGPIFEYTLDQIRDVKIPGVGGSVDQSFRIPTLREVLDTLGGRIGLEIEIKGPEPESPAIVARVLNDYKQLWESIEITSFEPALLTKFQRLCPGLITDLLFPRSEDWMQLDVVAYLALHRARLAGARAVHLHSTQLSVEVVSAVRSSGIEVHAWEVDDEKSLRRIWELQIPRICTNHLRQALAFRG